MRSLLPAVAEQLFRDVQKTYQETSQIPDDLLIALKFVFGPCALQALDLVDQRLVTCLSSPSGRKAYQGMVCRGLLGDISESCTLNSAETPNFMDMNSLWISLFGDSSAGVMGGSGRLYTCFVSCHYCPCPAFAYTVLRRNEGLLCKHILAVYLCQAMGVTQQESVSDQQMSVLLCRSATADA